jgi:hypothetical protein
LLVLVERVMRCCVACGGEWTYCEQAEADGSYELAGGD